MSFFSETRTMRTRKKYPVVEGRQNMPKELAVRGIDYLNNNYGKGKVMAVWWEDGLVQISVPVTQQFCNTYCRKLGYDGWTIRFCGHQLSRPKLERLIADGRA